MENEKKSYQINMQLEMVTDDDKTLKAIHINGIDNEPVPLPLWCDFLERLSKMTPGESVLFVGKKSERKQPVEKGKAYIIKKDVGVFFAGDYFEGVSDCELKHCRTGQVVRMNLEETKKNFLCVGDYDESMAEPISPESIKMLERVKQIKED